MLKLRVNISAQTFSDGGFFVFPDLSVKIEGDFRLRFSLFEMGKYVRPFASDRAWD